MKSSLTVARKIAIAGMMALVMALSLSLVGCGKSDEEVLKEAISAEFESMKRLDDKAMAELQAGTKGADFSQFGMTADDFYKGWLTGFDYNVDGVVVDGNKADVSVTLTCKPMAGILEAYSVDGDMAAAMKATRAETKSIVLPYTKSGNTWTPGVAYNDELMKVLMGS